MENTSPSDTPVESAPFPFHHYLALRHWPTWLGLLILRLLILLPYRRLMNVGSGLGTLMRHLMPRRRAIVTTNLQLAFPELDEHQREELLRDHFKNAGRAVMESALSWWGGEKRLSSLSHIHGLKYLLQSAEAGNGVILLSAHFTSFELGARLLAQLHPFQFIYKRQRKNPLFEHYTTHVRLHYYLRAITRHDMRGMLQGLKNGLTCWYLPDQDFGPKGSCFAPFMGVETATITTTSRLANLTGAAVVPYFAIRRSDNRGYDIEILPPLEQFPSGNDVEDCRRINAIIERYVRKAPAQYLWLHRRFRTRPEGEPSPYNG